MRHFTTIFNSSTAGNNCIFSYRKKSSEQNREPSNGCSSQKCDDACSVRRERCKAVPTEVWFSGGENWTVIADGGETFGVRNSGRRTKEGAGSTGNRLRFTPF